MFASLLLLTAGGLLVILALCPLAKIPWRFARLVAGLSLALTAGSLAWYASPAADPTPMWVTRGLAPAVAGSATLLLFLAPAVDSGRRGSRWLRFLALAGGCCGLAAGLGGARLLRDGSGGWTMWAAAGYLLSGFMLASVNMGWLLGHRYLTATGMSIDPLRRVTAILAATLTARWVLLLATSLGHWRYEDDVLTREWLMISIRIGVGLALPAVLVWMAWQCVPLRSTQSATGILFFTSVFVAIGELSSHHLADLWQVPA